jgi:16S rRNA (uracil1498-N3)-methyltransferase
VIHSEKSLNEPNVSVTLFQAIPKGDKLDTIVQKAVELGVTRICPVLTSRCVARPDKKSFGKKLERLNRIALEAAKQSGRGIVPQVTELLNFDECMQELVKNDKALICYECGGINLAQAGLEMDTNIGIFIGSEGGFDKAEVDRCVGAGAVAIGLGRRILRCETAPLAALSRVMNLTGNI